MFQATNQYKSFQVVVFLRSWVKERNTQKERFTSFLLRFKAHEAWDYHGTQLCFVLSTWMCIPISGQ
jgi:hypothetical protein